MSNVYRVTDSTITIAQAKACVAVWAQSREDVTAATLLVSTIKSGKRAGRLAAHVSVTDKNGSVLKFSLPNFGAVHAERLDKALGKRYDALAKKQAQKKELERVAQLHQAHIDEVCRKAYEQGLNASDLYLNLRAIGVKVKEAKRLAFAA